MRKQNKSEKDYLKNKFFHEVLELSDSEAQEVVFIFQNIASPAVSSKFNFFVEFIIETDNVVDKFKNYLKSKR